MIQVIPVSTPDVDIRCPKAMAKFTAHECVNQNYIYTCGTAAASTDDHGSTCADKNTHGIKSKNACEITCTDAQESTYTDVFSERTGMYRRTFLDISTESTGVHGGTCTEVSTVNMVVCGSTCAYIK